MIDASMFGLVKKQVIILNVVFIALLFKTT